MRAVRERRPRLVSPPPGDDVGAARFDLKDLDLQAEVGTERADQLSGGRLLAGRILGRSPNELPQPLDEAIPIELVTYRLFLLVVLVLWPVAIIGLLFLMSKLESYVNRSEAATPEEAGLEPVTGSTGDPEVRIVFGDQVVGDSD